MLDADEVLAVRDGVRDGEFDAGLAPGAPGGGESAVVAGVVAEEGVANFEPLARAVVGLDVVGLGHVDLSGARVLDRVHAKGAEERDLVTCADGVDIGVGTAVSAGLAAEVVLKDLLAFGGHVAAGVLADVLPGLANLLAVDFEPVEGVMGGHSGGQGQDGSGSLHGEGVVFVVSVNGVGKMLIK